MQTILKSIEPNDTSGYEVFFVNMAEVVDILTKIGDKLEQLKTALT